MSFAKTITQIATTYQEYDETIADIRKKKHKRIINQSVIVKCWGLVAIIRNFRVKVIIRQAGNGQKHFWSVIPAWRKSGYKESKFVSNNFGELEND
ncbi:MAG: hypothetical protein PHW31_02200 [Candidatus Pacebacteria bacterium]|nr:hypothetical protein [Candidatus Paceibacterota bacterium]